MPRLLPADHPQRRAMTDELHARPFPVLNAPAQGIQLAFKPLDDRMRDTSAHRDHLDALLRHHGAPPAPADVPHYSAEAGPLKLKWERHTEFVSYTLLLDGPTDQPFATPVEQLAPTEWLNNAPGSLLSAVRLHIEKVESNEEGVGRFLGNFQHHFVAESLAGSLVGEGQALAVGDFRIDEEGFTRFAIFAGPDAGQRRLGRIVQRLIEIENYRLLSMLALPVARQINARLNDIEGEMSTLIAGIAGEGSNDRETLAQLTSLSADIEAIAAETAFRFAASRAYAALVEQRIEMLLETRAANRQTFAEFMARRFDPAMRTCAAAEKRLVDLEDRAARAAGLLSARVNVTVETQNQALLESMNRRAELQLRLQRTVEGLSVVAISYYAVSLAGYLVKPLGKAIGFSESTVVGLIALPVIYAVWRFVRRIREELETDG
jgi:uncharacterized membrane-anchored protein